MLHSVLLELILILISIFSQCFLLCWHTGLALTLCFDGLVTGMTKSVKFQAGYTQLARSTGANVSVMVLQGCKSTPQKSRPIESGHGRYAVQVANVYAGVKNEFQY